MIWNRLFAALLLSIVISFPLVSAAQNAKDGSIAGKVSNSHGSAVAGAGVSALNSSTGFAKKTTADASSAYTLELKPGSYSVTFSAAGFKKTEVQNVVVAAGKTTTLDAVLAPGPETEVVVRQWSVAANKTQSRATGDAQVETSVKDVPLSSRNYTQAAGLASGVSSNVSNATSLGMNSEHVHVGSGETNNYLVDGVSVSDSARGPAGVAAPNPDAIASNSVQSWSYAAGPERNSGANIGIVTKSGTNAFHGTAFESVRNDIFNANDFFLKRQNLPEPVLKQNQFGFTVGGPIRKDRVTFFTAYQGTRQSNGFAFSGFSPSVTLPPLPAKRTAATLGAAFCPANHPGDSQYRTLYGGVQVACDGSNINPVAINLLNLKLPNGNFVIPGSSNGAFQTVSYSIPSRFREDQVLLNTDYVLTGREKITEKFFYSHDPETRNFTGGPDQLPGFQMMALSGHIYGLVRLSSVLTGNLLNELSVSGQRNIWNRTPRIPFTNEEVGISSVIPSVDLLDSIEVAGLFSVGGADLWRSTRVNQYQLADQVSWTRGRHTIRFGFEVDRRQWNVSVPGLARGDLSFNSIGDFLLGLPGCPPSDAGCSVENPVVNGITTNGSAYSNINGSTGQGSTAYVTSPSGVQHSFRFSDASAYLQDDIRLLSRLTLNAGLRWDYFGLPADSTGNITNFWPSLTTAWTAPPSGGTYKGYVVPSNFKGSFPAGVIRSSGVAPFPHGASLKNIAPRLGFSLRPLNKASLIVRGGYGVFFDRPNTEHLNAQPMAAAPYATPVGGSGQANYQASWAHPFPQRTLGWGAARAVDLSAGEGSNLSLNIIDENFSVPMTQKWNLEIQDQLPGGLIAEIGYAGAHSVHLQNALREINVPELATPSHPVNGLTSSTVTNASLRVPYLGIAANGLNDEQTQGSAKYNGLQVTVLKQTSNGLRVQAAYMFSKTLTDLGAAPPLAGQSHRLAFTGMNSNNPLDARQQYGPSMAVAPQRLAINYGWDFPWEFSGMTGRLLNAWGFSGTTIIQSGTPMTLNDSRGGTIYGNAGYSRAQFCPGMSVRDVPTHGGIKQRLDAYFNTAAFCAPPSVGDGTGFGNSSVGFILGPGQANTDLAVNHSVHLKGSTIELRAEFFNAFNHPQFRMPDTTVSDTSTFGQISSTSVNPRLIQFALKVSF